MSDSAEGLAIEDLRIEGNTYQESREGYNVLADWLTNGVYKENEDIEINEYKLNTIQYVEYSKNITKFKGYADNQLNTGHRSVFEDWIGKKIIISCTKAYTMEGDVKIEQTLKWLYFYDEEGNEIYSNYNKFLGEPIEVPQNAKTMSFWVSVPRNLNQVAYLEDLMITVSDEVKKYEQYGAMPSVEFPSVIQKVTGENVFYKNNKNLINFGADDYNWANGKSHTEGNIVTLIGNQSISTGPRANTKFNCYIPAGTHLIYSFRILEGKENYVNGWIQPSIKIFFEDDTDVTIFMGFDKSIEKNQVKAKSINYEKNIVAFQFVWGAQAVMPSGDKTSVIKLGLQLEKNEIATDIIEPKSVDYDLNLGNIELYGNNEVRDSIYQKDGKWYVKKKWGKVVLTGNEFDWERTTTSKSGKYRFSLNNASNYFENIKFPASNFVCTDLLLCSHLQAIAETTYNAIDGIGFSTKSTNQLSLYSEKLSEYSLEEFKELLSSIDMTVVYQLEKSTVEEITDETLITQLNELEKAKTYKNITHIDCMGKELNPKLGFTHKKDLETVFKNNEEETNNLKQAIVALGGVI